MSQNIQCKILEINANTMLSNEEKNKQIQNLLAPKNGPQSNLEKNCSHYKKNCHQFSFTCCDLKDPCIRCHQERGLCSSIVIKTIICSLCDYEQQPSESCKNCHERFSENYCSLCHIWTDCEISHCFECGICRRGKKKDLFHCPQCHVCFLKTEKEHVCANLNYIESCCAVCMENISKSQFESISLDCKHFIHKHCLTESLQFGKYQCPLCKKSMVDMQTHWDFLSTEIQNNPVPSEMIQLKENDIVPTFLGVPFQIQEIRPLEKKYKGKFLNWNASGVLNASSITENIHVNIYCNDCCQKSLTLFHFYGLQCRFCKSYNTQK